MPRCRQMCFVGYVGLLLLLATFPASCQANRSDNTGQTLALCGRTNDNSIRIYLVSVSETKAVTISQSIDLFMAASCPTWLNNNMGWLYGRYTDAYQRDVYLLDLNEGRTKQWFQLSGNEDIKEITLVSGVPRAVIIANQDGVGCSQSKSTEEHWYCVQSGGDLYSIDEQGKKSHLIQSPPPLCEVKTSPTGRTVAFTHSDGCVAALEGSTLSLVDTETRKIHSFGDNGGAAPAWSPDGKYLAFMKRNKTPQGILGAQPYIFDLEQNQTINLYSNPERWDFTDLAWSPDNQHLAWVVFPENHQKIKIYSLAEKSIKNLKSGQYSSSFFPTPAEWSQDGELLAWKDDSAFYFGDVESSRMYTVPVEMTHVTDWAFNNKEIAYLRLVNSKDQGQVFIIDQDSQATLNVTDNLPLKDIRWITQVRWVK